MLAEFFESALRIQELRDGPDGRVLVCYSVFWRLRISRKAGWIVCTRSFAGLINYWDSGRIWARAPRSARTQAFCASFRNVRSKLL